MTIAALAPEAPKTPPSPPTAYIQETEATHIAIYPNYGTALIALRREHPDGSAFWQTFVELGQGDVRELIERLRMTLTEDGEEV